MELLYYAFTEYNITESPEFKAKIGPLDRKLRDLAETDEAADEYGCNDNIFVDIKSTADGVF